MRGGSVHQHIDSRVHDMSRWLSHGLAGSCWCHQLHGMRDRSVHQHIDGRVHQLQCWHLQPEHWLDVVRSLHKLQCWHLQPGRRGSGRNQLAEWTHC
jgi:hypothetical protein